MATKTGTEQFTQKWNKVVDWSKQNGIPYQAYYPIYQQDSQRFLSGTPMSLSESIRAVQAAYGLTPPTALPTDQPSPTDVPGNIVHNAQNIFTGLMGVFTGSFEKNVWDTITNTVEHPSTVYGMFYGKTPTDANGKEVQGFWNQNVANFESRVNAPHTVWSFVPGMNDLAGLMAGKAGLTQLADNPLTTLLDVLPLGRAIPKTIAADAEAATKAGVEDAASQKITKRLGVTTDELKKMDSIQLGYRLLKSTAPKLPGTKVPDAVVRDVAGNPIDIRPSLLGERIENLRGHLGTASAQADQIKGAILKSGKGTRQAEKVLKPIDTAWNSLRDEERLMAMKALADDHRPESEVVNDPKYPPNVQEALQVVYDYGHYAMDLKLSAKEMVNVQTPYGIEQYDAEVAPIVERSRDSAAEAQTTLDKAAKPFDALDAKVSLADLRAGGMFFQLDQLTTQIFRTIRQQEPNLAGIAHGLGKSQNDVLWDRIVETQSDTVRNLLGFPKKGASRAITSMLPKIKGVGPGLKAANVARDLTKHDANALRDLFAPGGLLDRIVQAQKDKDWVALSQYTRAAMRKFDNQTFDYIKGDPNTLLYRIKNLSEVIHKYAVARERDVNAMTRLMWGTGDQRLIARGKYRPGSIMDLTKRAADRHQDFIDTATKHPPGVWRNTYLKLYVEQLTNMHNSAELAKAAGAALVKKGYDPDIVERLVQDPRTIIELVVRSSKNTLENNMMPDIPYGIAKQASDEAYKELAELRARGPEYAPAYIPALSPHDVVRGLAGGYNVFIANIVPKSVASTFKRAFDFTSSIYDVQLAIRKDALEQITKDVTHEYVNEYVLPQLLDGGAFREIVAKHAQAEMDANLAQFQRTGVLGKSIDAIVEDKIREMGYVSINPSSKFGTFSYSHLMDKPYYIHENLLKAIDKGIEHFQFPAQGFWDKGTKLFRFSILGLSPRYTMHILAGGTALVAYRGHASMLMPSLLKEGWYAAIHGRLSDELISKYPNSPDIITTSADQEGQADILFHRAAGYTGGNHIIREIMDKIPGEPTMEKWLKAAATANTRFTRAIVRMQRTIVYLDGAARAEREGFFHELVAEPELDQDGNQLIHSTTGKPMWRQVERRSDMTPEQAHNAGMHALNQVMGDLRHMTPLERSWFVRIFPFYGWTKHVLTYVLTYPIDHPYRAMFLSNLANMQSQDVASGLPTRIQLLFFLGSPDQFGNVSALDARYLDPLRDTANYASIQGFFQSLNPIVSAPMSYLDPQAVFGANELYPNVTYSQLYGVTTAGPQGNLWNVAEGFAPQLTALDQAYNLSGEYGYLKTANPEAFSKKIFQSLNIPFFQVQHINLRQIAAQNEIDRYKIAANAAYQAAATGDLSGSGGIDNNILAYPANAQLPDPLNTEYNVTPAYIEAMTNESEQKYGLPFKETATPPPNPGL